MSYNINKKYTELMKNLEDHIENKKDLEYIKNEFSNLFMEAVKEIEECMEGNLEKLSILEEKQKTIEEKLNKIQKDIYVNESFDFEIVCPYCNCEFEEDLDELKNEVICPECKNVIELDWNEEIEDVCGGGCSHCHSTCLDEEDIEAEEQNNQDDDM